MIVRVTEPLDAEVREVWGGHEYTRIFPGDVNGEWLRHVLGEQTYASAVRCGVIVEPAAAGRAAMRQGEGTHTA